MEPNYQHLYEILVITSYSIHYTKLYEDLVVIYDFFREGEATEDDLVTQYDKCLSMIEDLEVRNMLQKEEDRLGAILKINSGAGGTESNDWSYNFV